MFVCLLKPHRLHPLHPAALSFNKCFYSDILRPRASHFSPNVTTAQSGKSAGEDEMMHTEEGWAAFKADYVTNGKCSSLFSRVRLWRSHSGVGFHRKGPNLVDGTEALP